MQSPVDGGAADRRPVLLLQPGVESVSGEVLVGLKGQLKDPVTLGRELEVLRAEVILKLLSDD